MTSTGDELNQLRERVRQLELESERVREHEAPFHHLVEAVTDYAIFMLDASGHVATWNVGAEKTKGYLASEIVGQHFSVFYTAEDRAAGKPEKILATVRRVGRVEDESWRLRKDGSRFWANVIITSLRDTNGEIVGFAKVTRDLTVRRKAEEDELERRELESANRAKDEFLAVLGHELRNPLAPMLTAVHLIKLRRGVGCEREIGVLDRQVVHMMRLLDDLLDVSRIAGNRLDLDKKPMDIATVIASAVDVSAPNLEQKRHRLRVDVPTDSLMVDVDLDRITQVFSNVLNNAAKYTNEGGEIRIRAEASGELVSVTIEDNGLGITPDLMPRIFGLFTQGTHTRERQLGGFGVGLAVAKKLVNAHGGDIRAESVGVGHGSRFIVTLPRSAVAAAAEAPRPPHAPSPRSPMNNPSVTSRRILVVDDNHDAAEMLAEFLLRLGHDVRLAFDGLDALTLAREVSPQIVLMDLGLPGMDGFETARLMREMPACAAIPIIAISGYARESDRRDALRAGFTAHFAKPIDMTQLRQMVEQAS